MILLLQHRHPELLTLSGELKRQGASEHTALYPSGSQAMRPRLWYFKKLPRLLLPSRVRSKVLGPPSAGQQLSSGSASPADYHTVWEAGFLLLLCPDVDPASIRYSSLNTSK